MRVVLDTNVFISGIFWEGNASSAIIEAWRNRKFILISSHAILEEFVRVLRSFKIQMNEEMIQEWERMIIENAVIVEPLHKLEIVKADPSDDKFFEAAIAGNAQYIVSQDRHLLQVREYQSMQVLTPSEFLQKLKARQ
ncbi:putative toxin-antitoxin system toxin component, PIN family [Candidatus Woesearchaeota archaeon]|nr:putative toxin-antitoxin system toxin component, PIN family [Candidatus Woesearchaeota archaeon]